MILMCLGLIKYSYSRFCHHYIHAILSNVRSSLIMLIQFIHGVPIYLITGVPLVELFILWKCTLLSDHTNSVFQDCQHRRFLYILLLNLHARFPAQIILSEVRSSLMILTFRTAGLSVLSFALSNSSINPITALSHIRVISFRSTLPLSLY